MTIMNGLLYKALMAMDSYNRGYKPGIKISVSKEDADTIGNKIGDATVIKQSDIDDNSDAVDAGFYAIAYDFHGQTIISYRGTDNVGIFDAFGESDFWNGYGVGLGSPLGNQAMLAFDFYNAVAGNIPDPRTANISLTGHSLGGGLAGLAA